MVRNYEGNAVPVWNLEVAEQPEYFANGILVHNCVWALTELMLGSGMEFGVMDLGGGERSNPHNID